MMPIEAQGGGGAPDEAAGLGSAERPSPVDPLIGHVLFGKYVVDAGIAEGGMGKVYRGHHQELQRPVAIKVIQPELSTVAQLRERFFLEARALSRLSDPHIVSIVDFGEHEGGQLCMVMQYVSGEALHDLLAREGPLPARRAVSLARQVLGAIAEAHSFEILHRDIKPENVIVQKLKEQSDFAVVVDFGIARIVESGGHRATQRGMVLGTPRYMSPEQSRGHPVGPPSDLYSTGVMLFEMLTGTSPSEVDDFPGIYEFHRRGKVPSVQSRPGYTGDAALATIVDRMIERAIEDRYPSAIAAIEALDAWASGPVATATPTPEAAERDPEPDAPPARVAGEQVPTGEALAQPAQDAGEEPSPGEALMQLRLAERLGQIGGEAYVERFAELAKRLAKDAAAANDALGALGILREALALKPTGTIAAELWLHLAEMEAAAGDRAEALRSAARARAAVPQGKDRFFDGELAVLVAELTWPEHGLVEAVQRFTATLGMPEADPVTERWQLATRLGKVFEDAGDPHTAAAYQEVAIVAATRAGDDRGRATAHAALARAQAAAARPGGR
jgi:hypothetical protein